MVPPKKRRGWVLHWPGANQFIRSHNDCPFAVQAIQRYHKYSRGWSDGAYSFVLCPHGHCYELRGWVWDQFATSPETNLDHYTVCVLTDLDKEPTPAQFEALNLLIEEGRVQGCGLMVKPHSAMQSTACPGGGLKAYAATVDGKEFKKPEHPANEEDDELNAYVVYKDLRYANMWLYGGGGAVHLSPQLANHYLQNVKLPLVMDQHEQTLKSCVAMSGITMTDLVPTYVPPVVA